MLPPLRSLGPAASLRLAASGSAGTCGQLVGSLAAFGQNPAWDDSLSETGFGGTAAASAITSEESKYVFDEP